MSVFSRIFDFIFAPAGTYDPASDLYNSSNDSNYQTAFMPAVNPATGLPMIDCNDGFGGISGCDVAGNPYGISLRDDECSSANDDVFNHGCAMTFDHAASSFDCSSMFDTCSSAANFGCKFD